MVPITIWSNGTDKQIRRRPTDSKSSDRVSTGEPLPVKHFFPAGDRDVKCTMMFMLNHEPAQFKLDLRLARLLGIHTATRSTIVHSLWQYIKTNKLQVECSVNKYADCRKFDTFVSPRDML